MRVSQTKALYKVRWGIVWSQHNNKGNDGEYQCYQKTYKYWHGSDNSKLAFKSSNGNEMIRNGETKPKMSVTCPLDLWANRDNSDRIATVLYQCRDEWEMQEEEDRKEEGEEADVCNCKCTSCSLVCGVISSASWSLPSTASHQPLEDPPKLIKLLHPENFTFIHRNSCHSVQQVSLKTWRFKGDLKTNLSLMQICEELPSYVWLSAILPNVNTKLS